MKHPARWIAGAVALLLVVVGVILALNVGREPNLTEPSRLLGKPAPEFEVTSFDGEPVSLSSLAGKTVIVNFWNSWCVPCRDELPALQKFYAAHRDDPDFAMVGIVREDPKRRAAAYAQDEGMDWLLAMDPGSEAALDFATLGQPETFAISSTGLVAGNQSGPVTVGNLERMLAAARGAL